jgi:hypothetical protein
MSGSGAGGSANPSLLDQLNEPTQSRDSRASDDMDQDSYDAAPTLVVLSGRSGGGNLFTQLLDTPTEGAADVPNYNAFDVRKRIDAGTKGGMWPRDHISKHLIWRHPSFVDLVAEIHLHAHYKGLQEGVRSNLFQLFSSVEFVLDFLHPLAESTRLPAKLAKAARVASKACSECVQIAGIFPSLTSDDSTFFSVLQTISTKIQSLRVGDALLVPGGWGSQIQTTRQGNPITATVQEGQILFIVTKTAAKDHLGRQLCNFAVVNMGAGREYHPYRANPSTGRLQRALSLVLREVPLEILEDSACWYALLRPAVYPSKKTDALDSSKQIYHSILPFLNGKALAANANDRWLDELVTPDTSGIHCVMEALHTTLALSGLSHPEADHVCVFVLLGMCERIINHLSESKRLDMILLLISLFVLFDFFVFMFAIAHSQFLFFFFIEDILCSSDFNLAGQF